MYLKSKNPLFFPRVTPWPIVFGINDAYEITEDDKWLQKAKAKGMKQATIGVATASDLSQN